MTQLWRDLLEVAQTPSGLRWKVDVLDSRGRKTKAQAGKAAGSLSGQGRYQVKVGGKVVRCHRVVYYLLFGDVPLNLMIDHEDGNARNNAPENLKLKTAAGNQQNRRKSERNKSGVTGVFLHKRGKYTYARAYLGKKVVANVPVHKVGLEVAMETATLAREKAIEEANRNGAYYTDRHGKE